MTKRTIMEMAREVNCMRITDYYTSGTVLAFSDDQLEAFAELVREDERNRTWTQQHWTDYERGIAAAEREECLNCYSPDDTATDWADKIKARGQA